MSLRDARFLHVGYFSVKHSVSLGLSCPLKSLYVGNEKFPPFTWAQVTITFEGQAFYSVLELVLTCCPLGDLTCCFGFQSSWLKHCYCEKVRSKLKCIQSVRECRVQFPVFLSHRNQFGAWCCPYVWFSSNRFPVQTIRSGLAKMWPTFVGKAGQTADAWQHSSCSAPTYC